jgi:hypothetical protein
VKTVRARDLAGVLAVGALASAGCASLLGDFEARDAGDGGAIVLTPDAAITEAGRGPEAATPEGAPTGGGDAGAPLSCATWRYPEPIVLEALDAGNRRVTGTLAIASGPGAQVRILAGKSTTGVAFSAYTVETSGSGDAMGPADGSDAGDETPVVARLDAPVVAGSEFAGWARGGGSLAPATTVLAYAPAGEGGVLGAFSAYELPDSLAAAGPLPAPYTVFSETALIPEVDAIRVLPLDPPDGDASAAPSVFVAVTYPSTSATDANAAEYTLGVGVATAGGGAPATLAPLATGTDLSALNDPRLFRAGDDVYVFGSSGASSAGLSVWAVGDDGGVPGPSTPHVVWAGMAGHIDGIAANGSTGAADIALDQELGIGGYVTTINYFVSVVPYADLASWTASGEGAADGAPAPALTAVDNFTNVFTAPDGIPCGSVWSSDNLMLLGPGLAPADDADGGGAPVSGMNMIWFDAEGVVRGAQSGSQALLLGRYGFTNVAASPSFIGPASARWDVAWVETRTDDAGAYDVVFYDELDCQ